MADGSTTLLDCFKDFVAAYPRLGTARPRSQPDLRGFEKVLAFCDSETLGEA